MAFDLVPPPNLQTNIPQPADPLSQFGKLLSLKSLSGQQQLLPLEIQEQQEKAKQAGIQTQQMQLEQQSQQAMMKAWSDPNFLKSFTGSQQASDSGLGFDPNAMTSALVSKGVLPQQASQLVNQFVERSQKIAETTKAVAQTGEANAAQREKGMKILADKIGGVLDLPTAKAAEALQALKQDLVNNPKAYTGVPQDDLAHIYGADLEHLPAMATMLGLDAKIADFHKSKAEATKAEQGVIPEGATMSPEQKGEAAKTLSVETNPANVAAKANIAAAEGGARAKAEIEAAGALKPGYAFDPKTGRTILTDQASYLNAKGSLQAFRPVTEKEMDDDRQLNNRLADVSQKIARYQATFGNDLSVKDKTLLAGALGNGEIKVGLHPGGVMGPVHAEIPLDAINNLLKAAESNGLSDAAQQRLIAYKNAAEAMIGYQRILTGSARSSETQLNLTEGTLAHPLTNKGYADESFKQFGENLKIAAQGLPTLPGVKSPDEVVKAFTQQNSSGMPQKGDVKNYQGHDYKFDGKQWVRQ